MLLGKRPRPPMKRTTSMTEILFHPSSSSSSGDHHHPHNTTFMSGPIRPTGAPDHRISTGAGTPRIQRRNSADTAGVGVGVGVETAHFLRTCSLCNRRLIPGRDIYMYRGDSAFCSMECRQQQMIQDERKEKCCLASKKIASSSVVAILVPPPPPSTTTTTTSAAGVVPVKAESVAAAV